MRFVKKPLCGLIEREYSERSPQTKRRSADRKALVRTPPAFDCDFWCVAYLEGNYLDILHILDDVRLLR